MRDSTIIPVGVQRNRRTERVSHLLKVTQLVMFRVEVCLVLCQVKPLMIPLLTEFYKRYYALYVVKFTGNYGISLRKEFIFLLFLKIAFYP